MYLRRRCYTDNLPALIEKKSEVANIVKDSVKSTEATTKGEEKAKKSVLNWIKENPKTAAIAGTALAVGAGAGIYAGINHRKKKQAEALAEEAAQTAYSDTYDYYMRLFSDDEPKYTEEDLKRGRFGSYAIPIGLIGGVGGAIAAGRGNKQLKEDLRNGVDMNKARHDAQKKAAITGALINGGMTAAGALYFLKSNPKVAAATALAAGAISAGGGAAGAAWAVNRRARTIRENSRERRDL